MSETRLATCHLPPNCVLQNLEHNLRISSTVVDSVQEELVGTAKSMIVRDGNQGGNQGPGGVEGLASKAGAAAGGQVQSAFSQAGSRSKRKMVEAFKVGVM